jgi:hypothetical protein
VSAPCLPLAGLLALALLPVATRAASLSYTEQMPVEAFAALREVERYQMRIAQKHYLAGERRIALDEIDNFLTLYETSVGAPYAQLMWSHSKVRLRMVNAAIRDGFRSVIDCWPGSHESSLAAYLIARSTMQISVTLGGAKDE